MLVLCITLFQVKVLYYPLMGVGTLLALCLVEVLYYHQAFLLLYNLCLYFTGQGFCCFIKFVLYFTKNETLIG